MIVISNTSPIVNLAVVGHLHLLHKLYYQVVIPQAVYDELSNVLKKYPHIRDSVMQASWIECHTIKNRELVSAFAREVDRGEAEAIALANEMKADLLLLDEKRGRQVARRIGLKVVGVLGILVEAKKKGEIASVKTVLDTMMSEAGFWVSKELYNRVLHQAGE